METTNDIKLNILDFSEYPGPRYCRQGKDSGEEYYHNVLNQFFVKAYKDDCMLTINLDNTAGYLSSFIDEAFGNLVYDFSAEEVSKRLKIVSNQEPDWINMIENDIYVKWNMRRIEQLQPKKTIKHEGWYKLIDNNLEVKVWISI